MSERMTPEQERMVRNLHTAFDLHTAGVRMYRLPLRRRFPDETEEQIAARLQAWMFERPGAEFGDAEGEQGTWPRTKAPANSKTS